MAFEKKRFRLWVAVEEKRSVFLLFLFCLGYYRKTKTLFGGVFLGPG